VDDIRRVRDRILERKLLGLDLSVDARSGKLNRVERDAVVVGSAKPATGVFASTSTAHDIEVGTTLADLFIKVCGRARNTRAMRAARASGLTSHREPHNVLVSVYSGFRRLGMVAASEDQACQLHS
jgi:hypothetical protein